jgi:Glycosyl hydrolase family 59/Galactocerebrosidase, C-terminal lectin domain
MSLVRRAAVATIAAGISFSAIVSGGQITSLAATTAGHALRATDITIDGGKYGAVFQGVGAVSGGGGNSRLLIDYPPKQQQQILDYLFKPGYGASLQILKLEIGGDAFATDGAEPSIEHTKGTVNCGSGYEFWLAEQARALNPNIELSGLQWNAPSWVGNGNGQQDPWTSSDISYIISWLNCAAADNLTINYIGGWNEHLPQGVTPQVANWFIGLRSALDHAGYSSVQIVGVDSYASHGPHDISGAIADNPRLAQAVSVLGYHNLCRYPIIGNVCRVPAAARKSGKPIWDSEMGALYLGTSVDAMARSLTDSYIRADATGLIAWPLLNSMPPDLALEGRGLITASQPWSGQYHVNEMTWIIAQTASFTQPGWLHVRGANAELDGGAYGSYNTYEAPDGSAWTLVAQTSTAPLAQVVRVHITGGLPASVVHVWSTSINSGKATNWMVPGADIVPVAGSFSYRLKPGYLYTFTTVSDPGKGQGISPRARRMPLPYVATPDLSNEPVYLSPQEGAFDYLPGSTTTFEQAAVGTPVFWQTVKPGRFAYAVLGAIGWSNYTVSDSVKFVRVGHSAGLIARFSHTGIGSGAEHFNGYQFVVGESGDWQVIRNAETAPPLTLASGRTGSALGAGNWVRLSLTVTGPELIARINGQVVAKVTDTTYANGDAGISTSGWYRVQFTNLRVTSQLPA